MNTATLVQSQRFNRFLTCLMAQTPIYVRRIVSDEIRNALVSQLGIDEDTANSAVIEWKLLDNGHYGWVAQLPNGAVYFWSEDARQFTNPTPRHDLPLQHVAEIMLQIDHFAAIADCAFDRGDLDTAERCSTWAIGLTRLIG